MHINFPLQLLLPYSLTFGELSEEERVADMSYGVFSRAGFKIFLNRRCRMQQKPFDFIQKGIKKID